MPSKPLSEQTPYSIEGYSCWDATWDGFTVSVERVSEPIDATEQFASLPGGGCQCPHWGYVVSGVSHYEYADRTETFRAGEFFHLGPGHRPRHEAGTEWVCFSPTDQHKETQRHTRGGGA